VEIGMLSGFLAVRCLIIRLLLSSSLLKGHSQDRYDIWLLNGAGGIE
jgi:hypothetical protein